MEIHNTKLKYISFVLVLIITVYASINSDKLELYFSKLFWKPEPMSIFGIDVGVSRSDIIFYQSSSCRDYFNQNMCFFDYEFDRNRNRERKIQLLCQTQVGLYSKKRV